MKTESAFWDKISAKYRQSPIRDQDGYEASMERTASHLKSTDRVLELGCGTGGTALRLAPLVGELVATDFSAGMIAQAEEREDADAAKFLVADVHDTRLAPESFDVVMGFNLFHLVPDFTEQLSRMHSLLKPGGLLISKTPCLTDPSAKLMFKMMVWAIPVMQLVGKAPFVKFHTIAQLQGQIEAAGFEIIETGNYPLQPPSHFVVARKV